LVTLGGRKRHRNRSKKWTPALPLKYLSQSKSERSRMPRYSDRIFKLFMAAPLLVSLSHVWSYRSTAQNPQDVRQYVQKARAAYKEKSYLTFIENMKAALALRPNYGPYIYNIALGYALSGNKTEALSCLNRVADMGLVFPAAGDGDFASIKDADEFKAVVKKFEENSKPRGNSAVAFTFHEKGFVPEGIAYDPVEEVFYLGSVYKRKIVSINRAGETKDFSSEADGLWSVMGMRVDSARRLLWVCTASHPQMMNFNEAEKGATGLFKYDLKTKKLIKKYLLSPQPKPHWLGDVVLNKHGDVFTSDSITPAIYLLDKQKDQLELFLTSDAFVNPQGLAFSADEKLMFMADYLKGVFVIDMKTKNPALLKPAPNTTMYGIDGLYFYKGHLIGMQNGVNPNRLVELTMNAAWSEVQKFEVLEANNPVFDEPTLAVLAGGTLFYIANSQWGTIDQKGRLAAEEKLRDPIVLKLKL
jgi:tetratricopeptide (TPR) repeat protein